MGKMNVPSIDASEVIASSYEEEITLGIYDQRGGRTNHSAIKQLLSMCDFNVPQILDLGCGNGSVAQALYNVGYEWSCYRGIDLTPALLERFRERQLPHVELTQGDATNLSVFPDAKFDLVLCIFMLQHLTEAHGSNFVSEIVRVMKPSACLLIAAPVLLDGESVQFIGERGAGKIKTKRWNWGERVLRRLLHENGQREVASHKDSNPSGIYEYYLFTTGIDGA